MSPDAQDRDPDARAEDGADAAATPEQGETPAKEAPAKRKPARARAKASASQEADPAAAEQEPPAGEQAPKAKRRPTVKKLRGARTGKEDAAAQAPEAEAAEDASAEAPEAPAAAKPPRAKAGKPTKAAKPPPPQASAAPAAKAGKAPARRRVVHAHARYVRTSARKARMVCVHLRGKSVQEARAILAFTPREVARDWSKLLESAVANAESNHELLEDDLIVREAYADEGPTIKRFRPRAMGRATPIRKRTSHLTITLTPAPERHSTARHR